MSVLQKLFTRVNGEKKEVDVAIESKNIVDPRFGTMDNLLKQVPLMDDPNDDSTVERELRDADTLAGMLPDELQAKFLAAGLDTRNIKLFRYSDLKDENIASGRYYINTVSCENMVSGNAMKGILDVFRNVLTDGTVDFVIIEYRPFNLASTVYTLKYDGNQWSDWSSYGGGSGSSQGSGADSGSIVYVSDAVKGSISLVTVESNQDDMLNTAKTVDSPATYTTTKVPRLISMNGNMLYMGLHDTSKTYSGVDTNRLSNGGLLLNGVSTADVEIPLNNLSTSDTKVITELLLNGKFTLSMSSSVSVPGMKLVLKEVDTNTNVAEIVMTADNTLTYDYKEFNHKKVYGSIFIPSGTTLNKVAVYPMVEYGIVSNISFKECEPSIMKFESYHGKTVDDVKLYHINRMKNTLDNGTTGYSARLCIGEFGLEEKAWEKVGDSSTTTSLFKTNGNTTYNFGVMSAETSPVIVPNQIYHVTNRFNSILRTADNANQEACFVDSVSGDIYIRIMKSRLTSDDVDGFRSWINTNHTVFYTVVNDVQRFPFPCVTELKTFWNETNVIFSSGYEDISLVFMYPKDLTSGILMDRDSQLITSLGLIISDMESMFTQVDTLGETVANMNQSLTNTNKSVATLTDSVATLKTDFEDLSTKATNHINTTNGNPHGTTPADIGLGNVNNTADVDKPVSNAQREAIEAVEDIANEALDVAKGKNKSYVFDTVADLDAWLLVADNVNALSIGDNFLIRATDVPDYWWDGSTKQVSESQKIDLTGYLKTSSKVNDNTVTFTASSTVEELTSGTTMSTLFGKLAKVVSEVKTHLTKLATGTTAAHVKLSDAVDSESGVSGGIAATPAAVKTINDKVEEINGNLTKLDSDLIETKKSVSDGKSLIASAITDQGVTTKADATFDTMATNIKNLGAKVGSAIHSGATTSSLTIPANTGSTYIVSIATADSSAYSGIAISGASNASFTQLCRKQYSEDKSAIVVYKLVKSNKSVQTVINTNYKLNFIVAVPVD